MSARSGTEDPVGNRKAPVALGDCSPVLRGPIGFDLDMTLIDSRPSILEAFAALAAETGTAIDPEAVDRRLGLKLIITTKHEISVAPCLAATGLRADHVFTHVHGPEKAAVLAQIGAAAYVGDTPADMTAAAHAGTFGLGVATGSSERTHWSPPAPRQCSPRSKNSRRGSRCSAATGMRRGHEWGRARQAAGHNVTCLADRTSRTA